MTFELAVIDGNVGGGGGGEAGCKQSKEASVKHLDVISAYVPAEPRREPLSRQTSSVSDPAARSDRCSGGPARYHGNKLPSRFKV